MTMPLTLVLASASPARLATLQASFPGVEVAAEPRRVTDDIGIGRGGDDQFTRAVWPHGELDDDVDPACGEC